MKIIQVRLFFFIALFCCNLSHGGVIQLGSNIVQEDRGTAELSDDLFFYRDLSRFSSMNYNEQLASIDLLNSELAGLGVWSNSWRLASSSEMSKLYDAFVDIPNVFLPTVSDVFAGRIEASPGVGAHYAYEVLVSTGFPPVSHEIHEVDDAALYPLMGAWAVASYGPVPEPSAWVFLALGLSSIVLLRRKSKA